MGKDSERGRYTSPEGSRTWEYLTAVFTALGTLLVGSQIGWNSPSLDELEEPDSRIKVTPENASTLAACLTVGHAFALPVSVFIIDLIGRKKSILMSAAPMVLAWAMILFAEDVMFLIAARIISGFSMGILLVTSPIYSAEVLSADTRGPLGALGLITFYLGVLFMFAAAPYLGIRMTAATCMGISMVFLVCCWFVPESPYFLVMVGKVDDAEIALQKLRGKSDVADEIELIRATLCEKGRGMTKVNETKKEADERKKPSAVTLLFTIRGNVKALLIGIILTILQHLCGITTILTYCQLIFEEMNSGINAYSATLMCSSLQLISGVIYVYNLGKFKRRTLLFGSALASVILLTIIATYFFLNEHTDVDVRGYGQIPLYSTFVLMMALNLGVATMPGMLIAEIFSPDVKVLANCIVGTVGSAISIISIKSYLLMATTWGFGHSTPFYGYALTTALCSLALVRWLPETKDKTLLKIQQELNA